MNTTKIIANNIIQDNSLRKSIFKVLLAFFIILSVGYMYLIGSITFNVLARKSLETSNHELASRVANLELSYLSIERSIDQQFALSHGFVDAKSVLFATRTDTRVALR